MRNTDYGNWTYATLVNACKQWSSLAGSYGIEKPSTQSTKIRPMLFQDDRSNAVGLVRHLVPVVGAIIKRNDVRLYMWDDGQSLRTDEITRLVNHELAHVSHFIKSPFHFPLYAGNMLGESWAVAVEHEFTSREYSGLVRVLEDRSRLRLDTTNFKYSSYMIDLHDDTNQRVQNNGTLNHAPDAVSGYTLREMQIAMDEALGLGGFQRRLWDRGTKGNREADFDNLYDWYQDVQDANGS